MEVLFEIIKCHFILVYFGVFETILHLIQCDRFLKCFENSDDIFRGQVTFLLSIKVVKKTQQLLLQITLMHCLV